MLFAKEVSSNKELWLILKVVISFFKDFSLFYLKNLLGNWGNLESTLEKWEVLCILFFSEPLLLNLDVKRIDLSFEIEMDSSPLPSSKFKGFRVLFFNLKVLSRVSSYSFWLLSDSKLSLNLSYPIYKDLPS